MPLKYFYIHICFYYLNNFIVCGLIIVVPLIVDKIFQKANNRYLVFATAAAGYEV